MAATLQRMPFGEVSAARLQTLQSAKNRQNALTTLLKTSAVNKNSSKTSSKGINIQLASPTKRPLAVFEEEHNSDEENVTPSVAPSAKRSRVGDFVKPTFRLAVEKPAFALPSLTPAIKRKHAEEKVSTPILTPAIAPGGREILPLKHKRVGVLANKGSSSSPYKRIDPPSNTTKQAAGGLPFSIDAAISGTVASKPAVTKASKGHKAMPKAWFFAIHEDTPDEEAAIVMQHGCGTLDLSSDDEGPALKKVKVDKENIPPPEYVAAHVSRNIAPKVRGRKAHVNAMTDDGDRSPLSDLAPEDYFANGLSQTSVALVADDGVHNFDNLFEDAADADDENSPIVNEYSFAPVKASVPLVSGKQTGGGLDFVIAEDAVA